MSELEKSGVQEENCQKKGWAVVVMFVCVV